MDKEKIMEILATVTHPAQGDRSIVDLGMVESVGEEDGTVFVELAFPARRDPLTEYLVGATRAALTRAGYAGAKVATRVKDAPKKGRQGVNELGTDQIEGVRHIIAVASGKGGVGKSTVAVNLACALARQGYKVGLADADVYGPSVPMMTATEGVAPEAVMEDGRELILPVEKFGVKWMSVGYFASRGQALIWRGPMACSALKQMILQVRWGELDYLLIDMPPGTGDIHISLVQDIPVEGAVIVTTPQAVALADVEKGVNLFRNENVRKPILGIVENMSWFTPREHPAEKYYLFGNGGGAEMAASLGLPLLAQIPLVQGIRESGDSGTPSALGEGPDAEAFRSLAERIAEFAA
ncbi:MAG: Mrp/NBP35 family ATP-binding protein [Bacteroidales bacterium]|nr:Mrp/NBP35 family ATP-binding protein [Bacteroidales bacterium]